MNGNYSGGSVLAVVRIIAILWELRIPIMQAAASLKAVIFYRSSLMQELAFQSPLLLPLQLQLPLLPPCQKIQAASV